MEECAMPHTETKWLHQDILLKVQISVVYTSMNVGFGCELFLGWFEYLLITPKSLLPP